MNVSPIKNAVRQAVGSPLARLPRPFGAFGFDDEAAAAAISYLLQATFTGANQALANGNTLGPTGSGATYEGYTETGILTVKDTDATGSVAIDSNAFKWQGVAAGGSEGLGFYLADGVSKTAGKAVKWEVSASTGAGDFIGVGIYATTGINNAQVLYRVHYQSGGITLNSYSPANTLADSFLTQTYAHRTPKKGAYILGGFASGVPSASGTEGGLLFTHNGTNWVLHSVTDVGSTATLFMGCQGEAPSTLHYVTEYFIHGGSLPAPFTATGYAVDTSIAESDTFTHTADHWLHTKITTLPSAGSIDIGIRDDLAIRVSSAGAVTLVKAYATSPVTLITSAGTAINGSIIRLRQSGSTHELWVDRANKGSSTDAANATGTGGDIHSVGTGGVVSYIYSLPLTSATYDTALESF